MRTRLTKHIESLIPEIDGVRTWPYDDTVTTQLRTLASNLVEIPTQFETDIGDLTITVNLLKVHKETVRSDAVLIAEYSVKVDEL